VRLEPAHDLARRTLEAALDAGIRFVDTAPAYGAAEELVGQVCARRDVEIATKLATPPEGWTSLDRKSTRRAVTASVETSLKRLRRDRIELLQIHNATAAIISHGELPDALDDLRRRGDVISVGATVSTEEDALAVISAGVFHSVQVPYNLIGRWPEDRVIPTAQRAGVSLVARSVLLRGVLGPAAQQLPEHFHSLRQAIATVREDLGVEWRDLAAAAVSFVASRPDIAVTLLGPRSPAELADLIRNPVMSGEPRRVELGRDLLDPARWPESLLQTTPAPLAIVQARMSSRRLPGKVLMDVGGEPMLALLLRRLARAQRIGRVIVATSDRPNDDPVETVALGCGVEVHRGALDDVLGRVVGAAAGHDGPIVRITADCPLIDPSVVDAACDLFDASPGCDYASNNDPYTYPDGLDVEVISARTLRALAAEVDDPELREHVTLALRRAPERYKTAHLRCESDLGELRWTVDSAEDLTFVRAVVERLGGRRYEASVAEVLAAVRQPPPLAEFAGAKRG
jgi:spore coat polysaccharide biosynthesis protein SpsF (cytidylyltransferase family)/aryl-alcohol dehydrogenase-like predicted oxidoreductase